MRSGWLPRSGELTGCEIEEETLCLLFLMKGKL